MPWKECHVMDERLRFVARLLEGEKMAPLCAEFGVPGMTVIARIRTVLHDPCNPDRGSATPPKQKGAELEAHS